MANRSKTFSGITSADLNPTFRADVATLAQLPSSTTSGIATLFLEDSGKLVPSSSASFAKDLSKSLALSIDQSVPVARAARFLANRIARIDDDPALIVEDLVGMQIVPATSKEALISFLVPVRERRTDVTARSNRLQLIAGGGSHISSMSVFTDYRVAFDKYDVSDVDLDKYQPTITGLIPIITLQLEVHLAKMIIKR